MDNMTPDNSKLVTLTLTPTHARRLRALVAEELGRVEMHRRATSSSSVGYLSTLDNISEDFGDVYQQLVSVQPV